MQLLPVQLHITELSTPAACMQEQAEPCSCSSGLSSSQLAAAIVVPIAVCALLLVAVLLLTLKNSVRVRHNDRGSMGGRDSMAAQNSTLLGRLFSLFAMSGKAGRLDRDNTLRAVERAGQSESRPGEARGHSVGLLTTLVLTDVQVGAVVVMH